MRERQISRVTARFNPPPPPVENVGISLQVRLLYYRKTVSRRTCGVNEWTALNIVGLHGCVRQWSFNVDRLEAIRFARRCCERRILRTSGGSPSAE